MMRDLFIGVIPSFAQRQYMRESQMIGTEAAVSSHVSENKAIILTLTEMEYPVSAFPPISRYRSRSLTRVHLLKRPSRNAGICAGIYSGSRYSLHQHSQFVPHHRQYSSAQHSLACSSMLL